MWKTLKEVTLHILVKTGINMLRINILDITTNGLKLDLKELTQQLKIAGQKIT